MPNLLTPVAGNKWIRSNSAQLTNNYHQIPSIQFNQEVMSSFEDGTIQSLGGIGAIEENLSNPVEQFDLLNPNDGTTIGTATYQDVYIMLASLYAHVAGKQS